MRSERREGIRHAQLPARRRGHAGLRRHRCGDHPRGLSDRAHHVEHGSPARTLRSGRGGVLRPLGLPAVARSRRGGARTSPHPAHGPLPAVEDRPHHAGLPGGGRGDPHALSRDQRRPDGVAGQSHADSDLRAVDVDLRTDADVESVGRGQLLPRASVLGAVGAAAAGAGSDPGDRRGRRWRVSRGVSSRSRCRSASIR